MTTAIERTRNVVQTRRFLQELSRDLSVSEAVQQQAKNLLRHYPTSEAVKLAGRIEERCKEALSLMAEKSGPLDPILASWLVCDLMFCDYLAD